MRMEAASPSDDEYVDWIQARSSEPTGAALPVPDYANIFFHRLWPTVIDYFSPVPSTFLVQCLNLEQLNSRPEWIVRDGRIPLSHFFKAHPEPRGLKAKVYVEATTTDAVPAAWSENTGTYRVVSSQPANPSLHCILAATGSAEFQSQAELLRFLESVRLERAREVSLFVPALFRDFSFHCEYRIQLDRHFNRPESLEWLQLVAKSSFKDCEAIEINNRNICADNFMTHVLLSRGAGFTEQILPHERYVPLSPYHGYALNPRPEFSQKKFVSYEKEPLFPWADWFQKWE